MDITTNFKAMAENLRHALAQMGLEVSAGQSTELIAAQLNADTYAQLRAGLKSVLEPTLAGGCAEQMYEAIEIDVGNGEGLAWCRIHHEVCTYDEELFAFLDDEAAMREHFRKYKSTTWGYETEDPYKVDILSFYSGKKEYFLKAGEMLGVRYQGGGYWKLKDGREFRLDRGGPYVPELELPFFVPKLLKSTKGCRLLPFSAVYSTTPALHLHGKLIVPPGRDFAELPSKVSAHAASMLLKGSPADIEALMAEVITFARGYGAEAVFD